MIGRLFAAVTNARHKPPTVISAAVGMAIAGAGLALIQRYHSHLAGQVQAAADQLHELDGRIAVREQELALLRTEHARVRVTTAPADPPPAAYPAAQDLNPLGGGEQS